MEKYKTFEFFNTEITHFPKVVFVYGEDVNQRVLLKKIFKNKYRKIFKDTPLNENFFRTEDKDSKLNLYQIQDLCFRNPLFDYNKIVYLEDYKKIKSIKKFNFERFILENEFDNLLVLDSYSNTIPDVVKTLHKKDVPLILVECKKSSYETKLKQISCFCEVILGFKPQLDFVQHLYKSRKTDFLKIERDLFIIDLLLKDSDLTRSGLSPNVYKKIIKSNISYDIDYLYLQILKNNIVMILNYLEIVYFKEDKTLYLISCLSNLFEIIQITKIKKDMNQWELCSLINMSPNKAGVIKKVSKKFSKNQLSSYFYELGQIDKHYSQSNYSKKIGKNLIEQFFIKNFS